MEILYLLIPISLIFVAIIAWVFIWSVKSGQYDDMEGPAHEILMDNDSIQPAEEADKQSPDQIKSQINSQARSEENQDH
ncbi:MAG: cbb3-type cytochrome oxidase assembly protein CcoS [Gammaproteobacteria bacterium]|nr:MAG: cbb3-type cytochrome oxidase assembly protein CcoS [Gammaproteobacteria bacterium]